MTKLDYSVYAGKFCTFYDHLDEYIFICTKYTIDLPHFPWENFKTICVIPKLGIKFTIVK